MSIIYQIPHTSRFIETNNTFVANFNNPELGKYSFDNAANTEVELLKLNQGSVYLIERMSVGGNITEGQYNDSIDILPTLTMKRSVDGMVVYKKPFPINNYKDDSEVVTYVVSEKEHDTLIADFRGILNQTAVLVGVPSVKIFVNFSIYAIEDNRFYNKFRGIIGDNVGNQIANIG